VLSTCTLHRGASSCGRPSPGFPLPGLPSDSFQWLNEYELESAGLDHDGTCRATFCSALQMKTKLNLSMIVFASEPAGFEALGKTMQDQEPAAAAGVDSCVRSALPHTATAPSLDCLPEGSVEVHIPIIRCT
jgi:hypothetical protein